MFKFFSGTIKGFSNSISVQIAALTATTIFFFNETFRMQFWKDDYALLYNLQQKEPFYFPYQHLVDMFSPFFSLFGTVPLGYFSLGIISVFISSLVFYYFVYKLFSNKLLAFLACLTYVATPVGIDSALMMMTFVVNYFALTLLLLILISIILFYEKKRFFYYLISLILFGLSLEFVPFRSFYFGGIIILFEVINLKPSLPTVLGKLFYIFGNWIRAVPEEKIVAFSKKEAVSITSFILRQFLLISVWIVVLYVIPVYFFPDTLKYHPEANAGIFSGIINYKLLLYPLLTNVNILFAGIAHIFYQNFYLTYNFFITAVLLIISSLFLLYLFVWFGKKDKEILKIYVFAIGYLYLVSLAVYPYSSREIMIAANRYLTNSIPAYGILIVCIYFFLSNIVKYHKNMKLLPIFFLSLVLLIGIGTAQAYFRNFNTRSYYSTQFSKQIKTFVPDLPKNSLLYFKLDEDANVNYRLFDTSRGGHYDDRAYFAVLYNLKQEEINLVYGDFISLLDDVKKKNVDRDKIFAFKYSKIGLTDITNNIRQSVNQALASNKQ